MDSTATVVAHKDERIQEQEAEIARLRDERDQLAEDDYKARYENVLAENISLRRIVVEQDAKLQEIGVPQKVDDNYIFPEDSLVARILQNYEERLGEKDKTIASLKDVIAKHDALDRVAQDSISGLMRERRSLKRQNGVLKISAVGLAGYVVFDLVKGLFQD